MKAYGTRYSKALRVNPNSRQSLGEAGVSIIEALIASVILVIALIGFLSVAMSTTNLGGKNARIMTASALIYDKYEFYKSDDFDNIVDNVEQNIDIDANGIIIQGIFDRTVVVSQIDGGTPLTVAKNVAITITWLEHSVTQSSIFMK